MPDNTDGSLVEGPRIIVQSASDPHWQEHQEAREHVRRLAWILDQAFVVPGTNFRIGLDPLLGLIPVLGDLISMAIGGYLIWLAHQLGVPRPVLARMSLNVAIDTVLGAIPIVGDFLDAAWKANSKNAALLERALDDPKGASRSSTWYVVGLSVLLIGILVGAILLMAWLIRLLIGAFQ